MKVLQDYLLGVLSVPLSDKEVTRRLADLTIEGWAGAFEGWLSNVIRLNPKFILRKDPSRCEDDWLVFECISPYPGVVGVLFLDAGRLKTGFSSDAISKEATALGVTHPIFVLCVDITDVSSEAAVSEVVSALEPIPNALVIEPAWTAALLIEQMVPLLGAGSGGGDGFQYFSSTTLPDGISVRRARVPLQSMYGAVIDEPGTFAQKFRQLQTEDQFDGTILLATTFLPPVSHSVTAIKRFYSSYGVTENTIGVISEKAAWEQQQWERHIRKGKRIDLFDKAQLEEYLAAPEYYQMSLTREELNEQLANVLGLLRYDNYSVCVTSEAIDLSYEIRGAEVRIRTDRRNKGQPRSGRISGLVFNDSAMTEVFEREFWNMYRLASPEFKNKAYIAEWLTERILKYRGPHEGMVTGEKFDVFLCHNSRDKSVVKDIGRRLQAQGIRPWLDEWNLVPGRPWQRALEVQITQIGSAAAFVGADGIGPWQHLELDAFLREFANRGCPVIPVILPQAAKPPELPIFLKGMHWVDFRSADPDPLSQLIWGIRGKR
jgi:hypothetical protein